MLAPLSCFHFGPPVLLKPHHTKPWHSTQAVRYHYTELGSASMECTESTLEGGTHRLAASPDTSRVPTSTQPAPQEEREDYPGVRAAILGAHLPPGAGPRAQKEPARRAGCKGDA